jgi:hypothetical protein
MDSLNSLGGATFIGRDVGRDVTDMEPWRGVYCFRNTVDVLEVCRQLKNNPSRKVDLDLIFPGEKNK